MKTTEAWQFGEKQAVSGGVAERPDDLYALPGMPDEQEEKKACEGIKMETGRSSRYSENETVKLRMAQTLCKSGLNLEAVCRLLHLDSKLLRKQTEWP